MEIFNLKPEAFGLDISTLSLKIAKLKRKGKFFKLVSFGKREIEPGIIEKEKVENEAGLAKIIKKALIETKGEKIKTKYVIASLPEEKSFLRVIRMPKMTESDLNSAIPYEAENYIPMPIKEVYLDFQIISPAQNQLKYLDILIAAIPKEIVDSYLFCFKKAGLQPLSFEIESTAISRALIKDETAPYSVLMIDLGATRTGFIIFAGKSLKITSSIFISGQNFTEIISKNLNVAFNVAEELKIRCGLNKKKEEGKIFKALTPAIIEMVQQIKKHITYYESHNSVFGLPFDGKKIEKILLCGGGANLIGLSEFLSSELKIPTEIGNPWINIMPQFEEKNSLLSFRDSLEYTTALGLAIKGVKRYD